MSFVQYLRALWSQWYLPTAGAAVCGGVALLFSIQQTPMYQAKVQLFVSISGNSVDTSQLNQGNTFAQQRVKSYVGIVNSPAVTTRVIDELKLPYTPEDLSKQIQASSPLDTVLLDISVTDSSPTRVRDIANSIAEQFPHVIDNIETPVGRTDSPVKVSVTRPAELPVTPTSPRTRLNTALGILAGFACGATGAVVRRNLDRTIRSGETARVVRAPLLGEVPARPKGHTRYLLGQESGTAGGEAFRQLRTNIRFLSIDKKLSSFVITGSLPDEGKTTVAANLAITLAQAGERVVLVDGDLRRPAIADAFGLPSGVGLTNVLLGDVSVGQALHQWREDFPLYILTSGPIPPNPSELLGSHRLAEMIDGLQASEATVIFDSPPLLPVTDGAIIARATGGALMVVRFGSTRIDQLAAAADALRNVDANILGLVANRVKRKAKGSYGGYYVDRSSLATIPSAKAPPVPTQRLPVTERHR